MAGLFTESSMIRRVHRELVVALNGPRALLMQAAHPVAFAGFFMSTGALDDPYGRLRRTADVLNAAVYGDREEAEHATARVRRVHGRVRGALPEAVGRFPAGTPWAADDPDLLLWIIATLADSGCLVYERYVAQLTRAERDAYWEDWRLIGSLFGLRDSEMPSSSRVLELYMREMLESDVLHVSDQARRLGIQIVMRPPVPLAARPLLELANFITVGLLPEPIRRQYGMGWDPVRSLTLRVGQEYARRLVVPALPRRVRYGPVARAAAA
ncbi:MAG TPA: oxygenase MpaB family protein [Solirubrobacteraceae bacterium]|nr:oxygenase MpaB family protein [Solirubrobacteraceae bacterium]